MSDFALPAVEADLSVSPILRLDGISKTYGSGVAAKRALDEVSLEVFPGSITALVGRSGCGKSTLLNISGGLDSPSSGRVVLLNRVLGEMSHVKRTAHRGQAVAYIFQEYNLIRMMTVLENVCLPLELAGVKRKDARAKAEATLNLLSAAQHAAKFPDELSGGEQQRVAIARAMVDSRPLILADEPTGALDSQNGEIVMGLFKRIADDGGACIIATHNPEVTALADRVIRMSDGRILSDEL